MVSQSKIEWTEATWNPVAGCTVVSPGCTNCYAMRMAERLSFMGQEKYAGTTRRSGGRPKWTGKINLDLKALEAPRKWRVGKMIFVNSMSDLFHDGVDEEYIEKVFEVMRETPQHTYQILTKRSERLVKLAKMLDWAPNIWIGVSVEDADHVFRIDDLRKVPATTRFISFEPLLGKVGNIDLRGIHWAIAGGESGPKARTMDAEWVREIRDQCIIQSVAFHFKQWGGVNKKATGRILDGKTWDEFPKVVAA